MFWIREFLLVTLWHGKGVDRSLSVAGPKLWVPKRSCVRMFNFNKDLKIYLLRVFLMLNSVQIR